MLNSTILVYALVLMISVKTEYIISSAAPEASDNVENNLNLDTSLAPEGSNNIDTDSNIDSVEKQENSENFLKENDNPEIVTNIINGKIATKRQYPFITQIFYSEDNTTFRYICTGSLIGPRHILTAAHCVTNTKKDEISPNHFKVMVGKISLVKDTDIKNLLPISKIYQFGYKEKSTNDIALIELNSSISSSDSTPVKIYKGAIQDKQHLEVAGFGVTTYDSKKPSDVLLKTDITVSSSSNCTEYGNGWASNAGSQFCTERYDGNDSCQGDSGGPIVVRRGQRRFLAGLTSFGTNKDSKAEASCGLNIIAFYTRVAYFLDDIAKKMEVSKLSIRG